MDEDNVDGITFKSSRKFILTAIDIYTLDSKTEDYIEIKFSVLRENVRVLK